MCLNKTLLKAENSNQTKFPITSDLNDLIISYSLRLPSELTCNHCGNFFKLFLSILYFNMKAHREV